MKVINPLKGKTNKSWFFEQQVYSPDGIARAVKSTDGSGNVPKIIEMTKVIHCGDIELPTHTSHHQQNSVQHQDGLCRAIPAGTHGSTPHLLKTMIEMTDTQKQKVALPPELQGKKFRIRKLTPRECMRLMDVDDPDIDKMQASGLSNTALYKLAGNSIVVNVLYHIFRKMFVETENTTDQQQLTLF